MKTTYCKKNANITFTLTAFGNEFARQCNEITALCRKYDAQDGTYQNQSNLKFDNKGNVIGLQTGSMGGTIVFHAEKCNHVEAAKKLRALLESFGIKHEGTFAEIKYTHRLRPTHNHPAGSAYKIPQMFLEQI